MRKKHLITLEEFQRVTAVTRMAPASLAIVRRVLVDGESQVVVTNSLRPPKTKQHVNLLVNVFWDHYLRSHPLPKGWERGTVTLPKKAWPAVREREASALRALADAASKRQKQRSGKTINGKSA